MVPDRAIKHTPTAEGMLADIEAILAFGIRQPGHPEIATPKSGPLEVSPK